MNVTVVYEDQLPAGVSAPRDFGLHKLAVSLVHDLVGGNHYDVSRRITPIPKKSNSKVLDALLDDRLDQRGLLILLDADRIRTEGKVGLPQTASIDAVLERLETITKVPRRRFVLLENNTETVIEAAADCDRTILAEISERAIAKKKPNERDRILSKVSRSDARQIRDCILAKVPSLAILQARIACLLEIPET